MRSNALAAVSAAPAAIVKSKPPVRPVLIVQSAAMLPVSVTSSAAASPRVTAPSKRAAPSNSLPPPTAK